MTSLFSFSWEDAITVDLLLNLEMKTKLRGSVLKCKQRHAENIVFGTKEVQLQETFQLRNLRLRNIFLLLFGSQSNKSFYKFCC